MGPMRRALALLAAIVAALALLAAQPPRAHAALAWTMTASPLAVSTGASTSFTLVATNGDALTEIGCVVLDVPSNFTVTGTSISSSTAGDSWTTSRSGNRVRIFTTSGGDRLALLQSVTFRVTATAMSPNSLPWTANAYRQQDCSGAGSLLGVPPIVVVTGPAVTPTPVATPVSTLVPTPTPTPMLTPTPIPPATPTLTTPRPASTPVASPTATAAGPSNGPEARAGSPDPGGTSHAAPSESPAPSPSDHASMAATATASPDSGPATTDSGGGTPRGPITARDPLDAAIQVGGMELLSGIEVWAIPAATLSVPGLLVLLWVAIQAGGSLAWLPAVRRLRGERRS